MFKLINISLTLLLAIHCSTSSVLSNVSEKDYGILVMAHGGSEKWNQGIFDAVKPLQNKYKIEVAFGMADAYSIQEAIERLENRNVRTIGVVRAFISGDSWYERTQQILGLIKGAPERSEASIPSMHGEHHNAHSNNDTKTEHPHDGAMEHHRMEFWKVKTHSTFALSKEGISEAPEVDDILVDRAMELSSQPSMEDILIIGHGPGDEKENQIWIANMNHRAEKMRALNFHHVKATTLQEDWPEKRAAMEREIRNDVENATKEGRTTIVLAFRLFGFGPYASVLEGLDYKANDKGLLPHPNITKWIERQINELQAGPFLTAISNQ